MANPTSDQRSDLALRKSLRAGVADGAAFSVMVGCGETYLPAFVLAIGLGEVVAGLAATVPMLAGASLQLLSPRLIPLLRTHRRWVVLCASIQASAFIPLIIAAAIGRVPAIAVIAFATVYWAGGIAAGPAWNTWMSRAVPVPLRPRYFAMRARIAQLCVLAGLVGGGLTLHQMSARGAAMTGFILLFSAACVARITSAVYLAWQGEPRAPVQIEHHIPFLSFLRRLHRRESRLLVPLSVTQFRVDRGVTIL